MQRDLPLRSSLNRSTAAAHPPRHAYSAVSDNQVLVRVHVARLLGRSSTDRRRRSVGQPGLRCYRLGRECGAGASARSSSDLQSPGAVQYAGYDSRASRELTVRLRPNQFDRSISGGRLWWWRCESRWSATRAAGERATQGRYLWVVSSGMDMESGVGADTILAGVTGDEWFRYRLDPMDTLCNGGSDRGLRLGVTPRLFVFEDYSDWGMFLDGEALWILKATQGSGCREPSPGQRLEGVLPGKS